METSHSSVVLGCKLKGGKYFKSSFFFFLVFALVHSVDPRPMCLPAGGCVSAESQFMVTLWSLLLNQYLVHEDEACVYNRGAKLRAPF